MRKNVGSIDRLVRIVLGIVLVAVLALVHSNVGWVGLLGFVLLLTAVAGNCPLYRLFRLSTCPLDASRPGAAKRV